MLTGRTALHHLCRGTNHSLVSVRSICCHHHWFQPTDGGDNVWQMDSNTIKYGPGALKEVGFDATYLGMRRVLVMTDKQQRNLPHLHTVLQALKEKKVDAVIYDDTRIEPTDESLKHATQFASEVKNLDGFISVGGGSVMDTAKAANLYSTYPPDDFLDYINPPIGKGKAVPGPLKPHIACPTTSGTGSECTGISVFDLLSMQAKTGMVSKRLKPDLAIIDPTVTLTMPKNVVAASGFDLLSHAVESLTARPFTRRKAPTTPAARPVSQGANPWSDIGCKEALRLAGQYIVRAVQDPTDFEARDRMMFAATLAGVAFGNVGCHLPHGMSYPVSGMVRDFSPSGYPKEAYPMVPHGFSVILNAPSVFRWTASACPDRHLLAAELLGADVRGAGLADAGEVLAKRLIELMKATDIPNGLGELGYTEADCDAFVKAAFPQRRLLDNAPIECSQTDLKGLFRNAMKYW